MMCKNCGHEIVQATENYRKGRWLHVVRMNSRWGKDYPFKRFRCRCGCTNPEPEKTWNNDIDITQQLFEDLLTYNFESSGLDKEDFCKLTSTNINTLEEVLKASWEREAYKIAKSILEKRGYKIKEEY